MTLSIISVYVIDFKMSKYETYIYCHRELNVNIWAAGGLIRSLKPQTQILIKAKCLIIHTCRKGQSATGCNVLGSCKDVYSYVHDNIHKAV
jgi:hypothetical protein